MKIATPTGETEALDATLESPAARVPHATFPDLVRYRIAQRLGVGAMGEVFLATDLELQREVALKLVKGSVDEHARARLVREARGAAAVQHRHVVTVFDAQTVGDQVFIAMELVKGGSLRDWLAAKSRTWREVVPVFLGAGRGLAAVHAVGLVHRDFKPDNVLLDEAGEARVSDFGLVGGERLSGATRHGDLRLTQTRTLLGTPLYMAPETLAGGPATAASDQFSFCVSLYEALAGRRPFAVDTFEQLEAAHLRGPDPRGLRGVPRWLSALVMKGLARDSSHRFPSMAALCDELERAPRRLARRRGAVSAALGLSLVIGVTTTFVRRDPCAGLGIGDALDDRAAAMLEQHLASLGAEPALARSVRTDLERYAARWTEQRAVACRAHRLDGAVTDAIAERQLACFNQRRSELRALTSALVTADASVLRHLPTVSGGLTSSELCVSGDTLGAPPLPTDPARARVVTEQREVLAQAVAQKLLGNFPDALALLDGLNDGLGATAYPPVRAEVLFRRGELFKLTGLFDEAQKAFRAAALEASAAGLDLLAVQAWAGVAFSLARAGREPKSMEEPLALASALATRLGNPVEGRAAVAEASVRVHAQNGAWEELTRAAADFVAASRERGQPVQLSQALLAHAQALAQQDRAAEGLKDLEEARELVRGSIGERNLFFADVLSARARVRAALQDYEGAVRDDESALAIREELLGAEDRLIAESLKNLALWHIDGLGQFARGLELLDRSRAITVRWYGEDSLLIADLDDARGGALLSLGRFDEARAVLEAVLAVRQRLLEPTHFDVGRAMHRIGDLLQSQGHSAEALPWFERSLANFRSALGEADALTAYAHVSVGEARFALARFDSAGAAFRAGAAIFESKAALDERMATYARGYAAACDLEGGLRGDAATVLEQALEFFSAQPDADLIRGEFAATLARECARHSSQCSRFAQLAELAETSLAKAGTSGERALASFRQWKASRR